MTRRQALPATLSVGPLALTPVHVLAHADMGGAVLSDLLDELIGDIAIGAGIIGILLSALLGLLSFRLAVRMKSDSTPRILGRGVIALSSIFGFLFGTVAVAFGLDSRSGFPQESSAPVLLTAALMMSLFFLGAELLIAGGLYARAARDQESRLARFLSLVSYGLAVPVAAAFLLTCITLVVSLTTGA